MEPSPRILSFAVCIVGTLSLVGVAQSQIKAQKMQTMKMAKLRGDQLLTINAKSAGTAKGLVDYLKTTGASYYLESKDKNGKVTTYSHGSIPMTQVAKVRESLVPSLNLGAAANEDKQANSSNGQCSLLVITKCQNGQASINPAEIAGIMQRVNQGMFKVDIFNKAMGNSLESKGKVASLGASGIRQ